VCKTQKYTDVNNSTVASPSNQTAACGFNEREWAWCPVNKGDEVITSAFNAYYSGLKGKRDQCHVNSNGYGYTISKGKTQGYCEAVGNWHAGTVIDFQKANFLTAGRSGNAMVRDNADCVKKTVTYSYWSEDSSPISALAALFITTSVLMI
jgi:dTDP-4-amino-4,6-dideoxygalactose transaminase